MQRYGGKQLLLRGIVITNAHGSARPIYAIKTDAVGDITGSDCIAGWFA